MPKQGKSPLLATLRYLLFFLRIGILLGGAVLILIFLGSFLIDILFVASSPVARSTLAKFLHGTADPVVAMLVSGVRINTRIRGVESMPVIIATVLFGLTAFLNSQANKLIEWIDIEQQTREIEARRAQRKPAHAVEVSSEREKKSKLGGLLRGKRRDEEELLRARRELEKFRKKLAFLSIDMVGSTKLKEGRDPLLSERLFREYRLLLEAILKQHRHRAASWTADGVMACFLQAEVGCQAAKSLLRALPEFNRKKNPLDVAIQVRCGVHVGEVLYDESTPLELLSDRVLDVTGHLQKSARPNSLFVSQTVHDQIRDKTGFTAVAEVDGYTAFEWSLEPRPAAVAATKVVAAAGALDATVGPNDPTMAYLGTGRGTAATVGPNDPTVMPGMSPMTTMTGTTPQRIGRYEVLAELGRGAMGVVYKARDPQIGRTVAIKMILTGSVPPQYVTEYKKRFFREAQTAGLMSHPNIVTIYDIAEHESGQPYLVMEFVEGSTLEKLLTPKYEGETVERFPLERSLDIIIQVCEALDCAHTRGVIHRDIKPANILYTVDGKAKLADFGIAKLEGSQLTQTGTFMGTPAFMSPEQFTGSAIDQRSDLFSLAAVAYWMLTGETPFPGKTITAIIFKLMHSDPIPVQQLNANLPRNLDLVLGRCLAKRPEERYTTARELADDLRAILAGREPNAAAVKKGSASVPNTALEEESL